MMHQEFMRLSGINVSYETYAKVIEPMYMATNLSKYDFIKILNLKELEEKPKKVIKKMCVRNRMGEMKTPNGCYYYIKYVEMVDVNIKTGRVIVKDLTEDELMEIYNSGCDLYYSDDYDIDYLMCEHMNHKPITFGYT